MKTHKNWESLKAEAHRRMPPIEKLESTDRRGIDGNLIDDGSDTKPAHTPYKVGDIDIFGLDEAMQRQGFYLEARNAVKQAVNAHEGLVEMLKKFIHYNETFFDVDAQLLVKHGRHALAQAGEK